MRQFKVEITHLELVETDFRPKESGLTGVSFSHISPPVPVLNRFFYAVVGGRWYWLDRRPWTLERWKEQLADPHKIETWILSLDGIPAGYVELERKAPDAVEIDYLGLLDEFIGKGLGAHLLTAAARRGFAMGARRVLLNTCNLDHPKALANYQARGFKAVRTETKMKELPDLPPGPWDGA